MSVPAKREAAQAASLDQALVMVERERAALTQYERVEEVISAEKRVAALTDLLLRSGATDRLVNEATLLRMEASVLIADHVDEGQEDGQWTWGGDRSKVRSPDLALPITKQRLKECRAIRDGNVIEWFREMIDSGRVTWEHALRRAMRMNRTRTAAVRRSPKGPGSATIVQADIRTWRPDDIDAVLTDPPYVTDDALELYEELARFGKDVLPPGGICAAMVWTPMLADALRVMSEHLTYFWTLAWTFDHGRDFSPLHSHKIYDRWKPTVVFSNGPIRDDREWFHDHIPVRAIEKDLHPWQQTQAGVETLLEKLTAPGMRVADPFVGSGTTAAACIVKGRICIGADIDPEAVRIARRRIKSR